MYTNLFIIDHYLNQYEVFKKKGQLKNEGIKKKLEDWNQR